jgi:hypothetical protein
LKGERFTTAEELDSELGRQPDSPGDFSRQTYKFLQSGLHVDVHKPSHPLDKPGKNYISGKLSTEEYMKEFEVHFGQLSKSDKARLKEYWQNVMIPSALEMEERYRPFKATGQLRVVKEDVITTQVLKRLVNEDKCILTAMMDKKDRSSHAIAMVRPDKQMPPLVFIPGVAARRLVPLNSQILNSFETDQVIRATSPVI